MLVLQVKHASNLIGITGACYTRGVKNIREEARLETRPRKKYRKPPATVADVKRPFVDKRRFYATPGLREARIRRKMSQVELEHASGLSRLTIHNLEWGDRRARPGTVGKLLAGLSTVRPTEPEEILKERSQRKGGDE